MGCRYLSRSRSREMIPAREIPETLPVTQKFYPPRLFDDFAHDRNTDFGDSFHLFYNII